MHIGSLASASAFSRRAGATEPVNCFCLGNRRPSVKDSRRIPGDRHDAPRAHGMAFADGAADLYSCVGGLSLRDHRDAYRHSRSRSHDAESRWKKCFGSQSHRHLARPGAPGGRSRLQRSTDQRSDQADAAARHADEGIAAGSRDPEPRPAPIADSPARRQYPAGFAYRAAARRLAGGRGLEPLFAEPADTVVVQSPRPGAGAATPRVDVLVSQGPREPAYVMPHLIGLNEAEAQHRLDIAGLRRKVNYVNAPQWPRGAVIDQTPQPGTRIPASVVIELTVAN